MTQGRLALTDGLKTEDPSAKCKSVGGVSEGAQRSEIERRLSESADGWNRRDLSAYMEVYARGASTTYVSKGSVLHGYEAIKTKFAERLAGSDTGHLTFETLDFRLLGKDWASLVGRYDIALSSGDRQSGSTALLFQWSMGRWYLVVDHGV